MYLKLFFVLSLLSFLSACGGNVSGSGQIDYSSATVVEDLTTRKVIKLEDFAKKMFGSVEQKMGGFFWW